MKKFFKNPYIIAWLVVFGVIAIFSALSSLVTWFMNVSIFLIGGECIYTGVLLAMRQKIRNKVDITQFMNDDEKEIKKANMAQKEAKMNMNIIIFTLVAMGAILVYFAFRSI